VSPEPVRGRRPAVERAVDRCDGRVEHVGHLAGLESEDVAQDERGELAGRQGLKRAHEGQRDGLGLHVARLGVNLDRTLEERVGIWFKPWDFAESRRLGRLHCGHVPLLGRPPARRPARVETPVGRDSIEPGADRCACFEAVEPPPRGQQGFLDGVLGVLQGSQHSVAVHLQLPTMRIRQLPERTAVA
jgi:hypothetical protein